MASYVVQNLRRHQILLHGCAENATNLDEIIAVVSKLQAICNLHV